MLLGRMEPHRCVEFTNVELAGGVDIATQKASAGFHTVRVERKLCAG